MSATLVMKMSDWAEAEQTLRQSDYRAPDESSAGEENLASELGDAEDEEELGNSDPDIESESDIGPDEEEVDGAEVDKAEKGFSGDDDHPRSSAEGSERAAGGTDGRADATGSAGGGQPGAAGQRRNDAGDPEAKYGSSHGGGAFGADPTERQTGTTSTRAQASSTGSRSIFGSKQGSVRSRETSSERQVRRSRMLAYVGKTGSREGDEARNSSGGDDLTGAIDAAAVLAVLKYEAKRGAAAEEQPHGNPGYDIISTIAGGRRRLIEVKGLHGDWTERGVKLSHVQFGMAESHPEEFWIYVVENALDLERQRVTAIANPFGKVEEYWFDHNWRDVSEEIASAADVNLRVGAKLRHPLWGVGTIVDIKSSGTVPYLTIDFGLIEGRRGVPYSRNLTFVP